MENMKPTKNDWLTYSFTGSFYKNGDTPCRRELHIKQADYNGEPDLLVIMMNPGGSHPVGSTDYNNIPDHLLDKFVPTEPDDTQLRVIDFMEARSTDMIPCKNIFKYAVVINLTDKCESNSSLLRSGDREFSIFKKGSDYCFDKFSNKNMSILIAWGAKSIFNEPVRNALERIRKLEGIEKIYGFLNDSENNKGKDFYFHPKMRYKHSNYWINNLIEITIL